MGLWDWLFGRTPPSGTAQAELPGPGTYSLPIVGESKYQENLESICGERSEDGEDRIIEAVLVLEDSNPYDRNAVRVDIRGIPVGYLSREHAKQYRQRLRQTGHALTRAACSANIRGGWDRGRRGRGHYGVWLDLPVSD